MKNVSAGRICFYFGLLAFAFLATVQIVIQIITGFTAEPLTDPLVMSVALMVAGIGIDRFP